MIVHSKTAATKAGKAMAAEIGGIRRAVDVTDNASVQAGFAKARTVNGGERVPFLKRLGRLENYDQPALFMIEHDDFDGEVIRLDGAVRPRPR